MAVIFRRYEVDEVVGSTQDGIVDMMDWLGFLCARDYLQDVLTKVHSLTPQAATQRTKQVVPHVRLAMGYIEQSLEGPRDLAFLPAYYAILNLSKVCVLLGPRHADLRQQRTHGVAYNADRKDSHSVLTEVVTVWPKGVLPLFYETLTGSPAPAKKFDLQMKEILPRVTGISHEYSLASGKSTLMCALQFGIAQDRFVANVLHPNLAVGRATPQWQKLTIPCLSGFEVSQAAPNQLLGPAAHQQGPVSLTSQLRQCVKTYLLLRVRDDAHSHCILGKHKIEFPEEIPIWLLFFYMSSIVRYKPEFFSRLKDSKYWPQLSAARLHSFLDFLLAFWSFVHRKNYFLVAQ